MKIITLKGCGGRRRISLSGTAKLKNIPPYFYIDVDLDSIRERKKEKQGSK